MRGASDVVALVIGACALSARAGADAVRLDLHAEPVLTDPERACDADAPIIHPERTPVAAHPNVLAVYREAKRAIEKAREGGGPTLIECQTLRMEGHAVHDDAFYVPKELFERWKQKDPIDRFERHLLGEGLATEAELAAIVARINAELDAEVDFALASPPPPPEPALEGVYEEGGAS